MSSTLLFTPFYSQTVDSFLTRHRIGVWRVVIGTVLALLILGEPVLQESWLAAALLLPGITGIALATVGRLWCALYISGRKSSRLVDQGPYSMCRHPLYLCNALGILGLGLITESLVITTVLTVAYGLLYPPVIRSEDRLLAESFPTHGDYLRSTPAVWPKVSLFRTDGTWTVHVGAFNRNLADSLGFAMGAAVVQFIELMHELHWLPKLHSFW